MKLLILIALMLSCTKDKNFKPNVKAKLQKEVLLKQVRRNIICENAEQIEHFLCYSNDIDKNQIITELCNIVTKEKVRELNKETIERIIFINKIILKISERKNEYGTKEYVTTKEYKTRIKHLLEEKVNIINSRHFNDKTALMIAISLNIKECLISLIEAGANFHLQDINEATALMLTATYNFTECLEILVEAGANVDFQGKDGWTALMFAAENGSKECVEYLIDKGADVDIKNNIGKTALMIATEKGNLKIMNLLSR